MAEHKRKTGAVQTFDYSCLPDDRAEIARRAAGRIGERRLRSRKAWLGDAFDVHRAHIAIREGRAETAGVGYFKGWVLTETPFGERTAYNLLAAATMLLDAVGPAKFAELPPMNRVVTYRLAEPDTPKDVRDRLLPKLIAGETVTLRELDAALGKIPEPKPEPEADTVEDEPAPMREPSDSVRRLVRRLDADERRLIRRLADDRQLDMLVRAIDWDEAGGLRGGRVIDGADADRMREHAEAAARAMPTTATIGPEIPAPADDADAEAEPDPGRRLH